MKKISNNKIFKIVKKVLNVIVFIVVALFILVVFLQRFSDNKLSFFNYRMFTVVSGSMRPKYDIGDVLIAKETAPEDIKTGDIISYLGNSGSFANKVITHQVIDIEKTADNKYYYHSKGTANLVEDPIVSESQLFGVVKYKSVVLSFIYRIIATNMGMFICVVLPLLYIVGSEILSFMLEKEDKKRNKSEEK